MTAMRCSHGYRITRIHYLGVEHDLRGPVPAGGHVLGQNARVVVAGVAHSRQSEVTDLVKADDLLINS